MPLTLVSPKYRRNPNQKVDSIYSGVAPDGKTMTRVIKPSADGNNMEAVTTYGPGLERGQGGRVAVLVLGGMETTLDEVEYILEAKRAKKFEPKRGPEEIVQMCRLLIERRNAAILAARKYLRANPSEAQNRPKKTVRLHLPVGFHYRQTEVPGLRILAKI